jgi:hypothetical protein
MLVKYSNIVEELLLVLYNIGIWLRHVADAAKFSLEVSVPR